jgi:hypothetical protein
MSPPFARKCGQQLAATLVAAFTITCSRPREPPALGSRNAHVMAYDAARRQVMLFGGADERSVRGDTWGWDGKRWQQLATEGPPPRTFPVMAYDPTRERVLLFGGNRVLFGTDPAAPTLLRDLWAWNGGKWVALSDGTGGPSARAEACGGYDEERHRFVVFGGYEKAGETRTRLGDTWEWDGTTWTRVADTGPAARSGAAMSYVPALAERPAGMVLFGGSTGTPPPPGDTWHWDGRRWTLLPQSAPAGRFNPVMAYDRAHATLLRFGGFIGGRRVDELWQLRDDIWTPLSHRGPAGRNHSAWAYDGDSHRLVLYGGHDGDQVFADTWTWDGTAWSRATERPPERRIDNGH